MMSQEVFLTLPPEIPDLTTAPQSRTQPQPSYLALGAWRRDPGLGIPLDLGLGISVGWGRPDAPPADTRTGEGALRRLLICGHPSTSYLGRLQLGSPGGVAEVGLGGGGGAVGARWGGSSAAAWCSEPWIAAPQTTVKAPWCPHPSRTAPYAAAACKSEGCEELW
ncbi:hypothetical protein E2C01_013508 [Portunus trituberculatus]|uniref:Uncharacterized protein n=1 Tax=Portunus trituberculatus TaxID=210409 RepID=A0A5B7DHG8_PORTR|nr:hypothetical protein [Portunus trituberculatus]